jgi:acyl-CoA thioesterase
LYDSGVILGSQLDGPDDVGPAELPTWIRCPNVPPEQHVQQGLASFISNFPLVGVAMRPHAGLSAELSHLKVTTGVLAHTISFHEELDLSEWTMLNYEVPSAGRGRYSGRGQILNLRGEHVASFAQDGMIRALADAATGGAGARL